MTHLVHCAVMPVTSAGLVVSAAWKHTFTTGSLSAICAASPTDLIGTAYKGSSMATKKKRKGKIPKGAKRTGVSKVAIHNSTKGKKKPLRGVVKSHKTTPKKKVAKKITRRGTRHTPEVTEENKLIALQAIRDKLSIQHACDSIGINRATFYAWMHKDANFAAEVAQAQEGACDLLEECLFDRAKDRRNKGGVASAIFLLKGRRSNIYHDRQHNVVTGAGGGPVAVANWIDLVNLASEAKDE